MGVPFTIRLSGRAAPQFPDRCILCEQADPDSSTLIPARRTMDLVSILGAAAAPVLMLFAERAKIRVPLCRRHRVTFLSRGYLRNVALAAALVLAIIGVTRLTSLEPLIGGLLLVVVSLATLWLWAFFEAFVPRLVTVAITEHHVDYAFTSHWYAIEFASINASEVVNRIPLALAYASSLHAQSAEDVSEVAGSWRGIGYGLGGAATVTQQINPDGSYSAVVGSRTFTGRIQLIDGWLRGTSEQTGANGTYSIHERNGRRLLVYISDDGTSSELLPAR